MSRTLINVSGQTHNPAAGQAPNKEGSSAAARNGQTSKLPTGPAAGIKAKRSAPIMKRLKKRLPSGTLALSMLAGLSAPIHASAAETKSCLQMWPLRRTIQNLYPGQWKLE